MNTVSRTISGAVTFLLGLLIIFVTVSDSSDAWSRVWGVAWGVFIGGVGIYLLLNKKEDDIEEVKNSNK